MLSLLEDFIADPINPNINGLLEKIKQACRVMVDESGIEIFIIYYYYLRRSYVLYRECGSRKVNLLVLISEQSVQVNHVPLQFRNGCRC